MCTFGIDELRQQPAEILLRWRNAEAHALRAHLPVEGLHVGDSEPEFDLSRRVLVGSRMQGESGVPRREFTPGHRIYGCVPGVARWRNRTFHILGLLPAGVPKQS